jgi:hypothetical protein
VDLGITDTAGRVHDPDALKISSSPYYVGPEIGRRQGAAPPSISSADLKIHNPKIAYSQSAFRRSQDRPISSSGPRILRSSRPRRARRQSGNPAVPHMFAAGPRRGARRDPAIANGARAPAVAAGRSRAPPDALGARPQLDTRASERQHAPGKSAAHGLMSLRLCR